MTSIFAHWISAYLLKVKVKVKVKLNIITTPLCGAILTGTPVVCLLSLLALFKYIIFQSYSELRTTELLTKELRGH